MTDNLTTIIVAVLSCGEIFSLIRYFIDRKDKKNDKANVERNAILHAQKCMLRHDIIHAYELASRRGYTTTQEAMSFYELIKQYDNVLAILDETNGYVEDVVEHFKKIEVKQTLDG